MYLTNISNRVILFGCKITEDVVTAELSFFAANLSTKSVELINKNERVVIELPDNVLNQNMPGKLPPHSSFKILSIVNCNL
jgi:hypothetical protein